MGSAPDDLSSWRPAARVAGAVGREPSAARTGTAGMAAADPRYRSRAGQLARADEVDRRVAREPAAPSAAARGLARRHAERPASDRIAHRFAEPLHRRVGATGANARSQARSCRTQTVDSTRNVVRYARAGGRKAGARRYRRR